MAHFAFTRVPRQRVHFVRKSELLHINHGEAVYIIKTKSCISSNPQELHIIIAKKYSLRLMGCTLRVMIYHCFRNG